MKKNQKIYALKTYFKEFFIFKKVDVENMMLFFEKFQGEEYINTNFSKYMQGSDPNIQRQSFRRNNTKSLAMSLVTKLTTL